MLWTNRLPREELRARAKARAKARAEARAQGLRPSKPKYPRKTIQTVFCDEPYHIPLDVQTKLDQLETE